MSKIRELENELAGLKSAIEAGDESAMDRAETIMENELPKAKRAAELAKAITGPKVEREADAEPKTFGDWAVKNLDLSAIKAGTSKTAATPYGYKAATDIHGTVGVLSVETQIPGRRIERLRDLFGQVAISGNTYEYFVEGITEGAPDVVTEGDEKPQFHMVYTPKTVALAKIAGWFYESDELLEDAAWLASAINDRGLRVLDQTIDATLAATLYATSGIPSVNSNGDTLADAIFEAIMSVKTESGLEADTVILNPADYAALLLAKDGNDQYYGGGYVYGPYGNGEYAGRKGIWGLNVWLDVNMTEGDALVGAFKDGATVATKANAGARIEVVTGDHDDRTHNRVTVVVEERLALAVRIPGAFAYIEDLGSE